MAPAQDRRPAKTTGEKSAEAFRTISEVASELDLPQHVLRFWETKFPHVRPLKRGGGRRYYRPEDIRLLRRIRDLLYNEGYTIRGVQKLLRENGARALADEDSLDAPQPLPPGANEIMAAAVSEGAAPAGLDPVGRAELETVIAELLRLRDLLDKARR